MTKLAILLVVGVIAQVYGDEPEAIVGGSVAQTGQFPYQISLRQGSHICGGTIIGNRHIVTAAHCISTTNPRSYTVVTGTNSVYSGQVHQVKCIQCHPGFNMRNLKQDICVLTLEAPITFDNLRKPIPLASRDYATGNTQAIVSGWGKTSVNSGVSTVLKYLGVRCLSSAECRQWHGDTDYTQICTMKGRGEGACQGDSGGPLVANGELVGVVSWGIPCALGQPDVFTNVYYYRDFIQQCQQKC